MANLGCGRRYHPDWINIDIVAHSPAVIAHDLRKGIPLPNDHCAIVYHSNIIEHMRQHEAPFFLRECLRVLRPGGLLRIATPDLEEIVLLYLEKLRNARQNLPNAEEDYRWVLLEMYDQTVRERSGGAMVNFLKRDPLLNEAFIVKRIGEEGSQLIHHLRHLPAPPPSRPSWTSSWERIAHRLHEYLLRLIAGDDAPQALEIGRFRLAGEVHQWIYDSYSLARLLQECGFEHPVKRAAQESADPRWTSYHLDSYPDGTPVKPDSFFMEATKPL